MNGEMMFLIGMIMLTTLIIIILGAKCLNYRKDVDTIATKYNKFVASMNNVTPSLSDDVRLKLTEDFLHFVDNLISLEMVNAKRQSIFLGKESAKEIDYDKKISEVATSVYDSLQPDYLENPNLIVSPEYLQRYIAKKTFIAYMTYVENMVEYGGEQ